MTRQIGPVGTAGRAILGVAAIAYALLAGGVGAWDIAAAAVGFPALAVLLYLCVSRACEHIPSLRPASPQARAWIVSVAVLVLLLAIGTGLTFPTPIDAGAILLFFGASLLLVAARGDAGCEVLAIVNALTGRRETTGCVAFAAVDSVETRLWARSA